MYKVLTIIIYLLAFHAGWAQQATKTYNGPNNSFSIAYPADWLVADDDVFNFSPVENCGAVTIGFFQGMDVSIEQLPNYIIATCQTEGDPSDITVQQNGDTTTFFYEYVKDNVNWVIKLVRRGTDIYLLAINCDGNRWEADKQAFLDTLKSFRLL